MNEQEWAQLLSEQLDEMLEGEAVDFSTVVDELQGPLQLGQQLATVDFPPSSAAEVAFESQLANWFGPSVGPAFPTTGLTKTGFVNYAIIGLIGVGLGGLLLLGSLLWSGSGEEVTPAATLLPTKQETMSESPTLGRPINDNTATVTPMASPTTAETVAAPQATTSLGDTIQLKPTTTVSDTLPTTTLTPPADPLAPATSGSDEQTGDETNADQDVSSGDETGDSSETDSGPTGDHDRGHGNDADGIDDDNPGNSTGLPDNGGGNPSPGDFSQGNGGGSSGNGGQSGGSGGQSNDTGNGKSDNNGNGKGNGKSKGKGK